MRFLRSIAVACAVLVCLCVVSPGAVDGGPARQHRNEGTLVICGGGRLPDSIRDEFTKGLTDDSNVVILATASSDPAAAAARATQWLSTPAKPQLLTPELTDDGHVHDTEELLSAVSRSIAAADAVWITGGQQSRLATRYTGTPVEQELLRLLDRGGTVGGTSAGAAVMSQVMIQSGRLQPKIGTGFDLLKHAIIDQHFSQRSRIARSRIAVRHHPDRFGVGIDESTAAVVEDRRLKVQGSGTVTLLRMTPRQERPAEVVLRSGDVVDLDMFMTTPGH